ncbi:hypothetical protein BJ165DRAFT_1455927 [Panaeolus papilionaceus]|nr:hypothetical protein BJ165DRAFT_1455927 [Panaeolus papilionaceus]
MQNFTTLPNELLGAIGEHISLTDVKQLRLTCKDFSATFAPCVLSFLKFHINTANYERQLSMLRRLASGKSHASHVTKTLHIGSLSPRLSRYCPDSTLDGEDKVLAVEAEIRENLEKALLSLRSVESFCWHQNTEAHSRVNERWIYSTLSTFLKACTSLRSFDFNITTYWEESVPTRPDDAPGLLLPFENMSQITSIEWSGFDVRYGMPNFQRLALNIALYKDLDCISLSDTQPYDGEPRDLLGSLFLTYPDSNPPLRLNSLSLSSTIPVLTTPLLRHLRCLTHLTLTGQHYLSSDPQRRLTVLNDFYSALKEANIQLHQLDITDAPAELFSYLENYTGLKVMKVNVFGFFDEWSTELANAAARRFYDVIHGHASSLESLRVSYGQKGDWTFNISNAPIWSKMTRLRNALVVVTETSYVDRQLVVGEMPRLMETFMSLPCLQLLEIECEQGIETGYHPMDYSPAIYNGVRAFIRSFQLPIRQRKPFSIKFSSRVLEPAPNSNGSCWVYYGDQLGEEHDIEDLSDGDGEGLDEDWDDDWDLMYAWI